MMGILYICYQSIAEPLTQTQVVPYLEGLAVDTNSADAVSLPEGEEGYGAFKIVLLTFEPRALEREEQQAWREKLARRGIEWHWVRYHKRPRLPATAWDILVGCWTAWRIMRRSDKKARNWILHARGHVPGVMAFLLKRRTGARFLFDVRGFLAEEYADAGILKPDGFVYRTVKHWERRLVRAADALVVLTRKAKELLVSWYPDEVRGKPIEVIPCCVDLRVDRKDREELGVRSEEVIIRRARAQRSEGETTLNLVYVGKLGGWYLTEEMVRFVAIAREVVPALRWQVWTQSGERTLDRYLAQFGLSDIVYVRQISPERILSDLSRQADAGIAFIKPCLSKLASSPTKIGEYLAAGLPVVVNTGIGDVDELILGPDGPGSRGDCPTAPAPRVRKGWVGVVLYEFSEAAYREAAYALLDLLAEPGIRERCRDTARRHLDLRGVGWVRYRSIYGQMGAG
jgi:glycosyltransferase involved in cell wall biosynthesis